MWDSTRESAVQATPRYVQLGQTNTVQTTTTNLSNWTSLTSVVVSTVPMDVVDFTASNFPSRFYRTFSQ